MQHPQSGGVPGGSATTAVRRRLDAASSSRAAFAWRPRSAAAAAATTSAAPTAAAASTTSASLRVACKRKSKAGPRATAAGDCWSAARVLLPRPAAAMASVSGRPMPGRACPLPARASDTNAAHPPTGVAAGSTAAPAPSTSSAVVEDHGVAAARARFPMAAAPSCALRPTAGAAPGIRRHRCAAARRVERLPTGAGV